MSAAPLFEARHDPTDSAAMRATIDWLEGSVPAEAWFRPHLPQIKVGQVNYYPDNGTLQIDGAKSVKRQPLSAFQAAVSQHLLGNE